TSTNTPVTPATSTNTPVTPGAPTSTNTPVTPATSTNTPVTPTTPGGGTLAANKVASVGSAAIGEQFDFSISVFTSSRTAIGITIRDTINPQLTIVSISPTNGSCPTPSGNDIVCNVSARSGAPATVTIRVLVSSNAQPGTQISNQALVSVSNDPNNSVLSNRV